MAKVKELQSFYGDALSTYNSMTQLEQINFIASLLSSSDNYVKWRVYSILAHQDNSDFVAILPFELQEKLFSYLDNYSLLQAAKVSKLWNKVLLNQYMLLKKRCLNLGLNEHISIENASVWHKVFVELMRLSERLKKNVGFQDKTVMLQNCKKPVKVVDYSQGYICAVSEDEHQDYVNIWHLELNIPILSQPFDRNISCVQFKPKHILVCGHFTGKLTSWDLTNLNYPSLEFDSVIIPTYSNSACFKNCEYNMHQGPVLTCDFCVHLDLLVSGSADECIKIWKLSSGEIMHSLPNQGHWVLRVLFQPACSCSLENHQLISMTRDHLKAFFWKAAKCDKANLIENCSISSSLYKNTDYTLGNVKSIKCCAMVNLNESKSNFFTPGLHASSKYIGLIKQDLDEKYASLCLFDIKSFNLLQSIKLNFKVKKLLAIGSRYAIILTVGHVLYYSSLVIIDIVSGKEVGKHAVPHSKMTTPNGAQIVVGDTEWLDGFSISLEVFKESMSNKSSKENFEKSDFGFNRCKLSIFKNLILATAVENEPGRLFTLWWKDPSDSFKHKEE